MMRTIASEPAIPSEEDPVAYADLLGRVHDAVASGGRPPAHPRTVIDRSWRRMLHTGVSTDQQEPDVDADRVPETIEAVTAAYGDRPEDFLSIIRTALAPALVDSRLLGVVAAPDSRILYRFGDHEALRRADRLSFVDGARWSETTVGTNAIGTAAVMGGAVQIHGPEHWCTPHHDWSCAAAPIVNPASGAVTAIIDVSGPLRTAHPAVLALVESVAAQVRMGLVVKHRRELARLREQGPGTVRGGNQPWVLCDRHGWVADAAGVRVPTRVNLDCGPAGATVLPGLGIMTATRVGAGVLLVPDHPTVERPGTISAGQPRYELDRSRNSVCVDIHGCRIEQPLTRRHCQIIATLADAAGPLSPEELARLVWSEAARAVTVRAEVSRLRKKLPGLISGAPYRLTAPLGFSSPAV